MKNKQEKLALFVEKPLYYIDVSANSEGSMFLTHQKMCSLHSKSSVTAPKI
jgi:hypothetical protein